MVRKFGEKDQRDQWKERDQLNRVEAQLNEEQVREHQDQGEVVGQKRVIEKAKM